MRELEDDIVRPFSTIFDQSCCIGEVPEEQKKAVTTPLLKKDPENRVSQPHLHLWESVGTANAGNHFQAHEQDDDNHE